MRGEATDASAPLPAGGQCEFVDAGGGVALLRLIVPGFAAPENADLHADGERFVPLHQPTDSVGGEVPAAFAGPLEVLRRPGVQIVLRGADGRERLLPAPGERECSSPARQKALIEQLRRRCEIDERALRDARADLDGSERLVKAWREAGELRELLDIRAGSDRTLDSQLDEARAELERAEVESALAERIAELDSALAAHTSERAALVNRATTAERIARRRQAEVECLEAALGAQRARPRFERVMLREGKRRELGLRRRVEALERELADRDARLRRAERPLAPTAALRQLAVAVAGSAEAAARARGGDAPGLVGRPQRRFAR